MTGIEGEERDCGCGRDNTRIERERDVFLVLFVVFSLADMR